MKKFLLITAGLAFLAGVTSGQEYKSRQPYPNEVARVAGVSKYIQDVYLQSTTPKVIMSNPYYATNYNDGIIFAFAGSTSNISIVLPNPTNNTGRRYEIRTAGPATALATNDNAGWKFWNLYAGGTPASGFAIASNKTAIIYSTGTNWAVYSH